MGEGSSIGRKTAILGGSSIGGKAAVLWGRQQYWGGGR